ncbi:MAG: hypothetical protein GY895_22165, partial [Phycisphaera sp.]|nr:hypothetical protein [Phycisphaera sp.]
MLHAVLSDGAFFFWGERIDQTSVPPPVNGMGGDAVDDSETMPGITPPVEVEDSSASSLEAAAAVATTAVAPASRISLHPFAADVASIANMLQNVQDADPEARSTSDGDEACTLLPLDPSSQATELRLLLPHRTDHQDLPAPSLALGARLGFKTPEPEDLRPQATIVPAFKATPAQA